MPPNLYNADIVESGGPYRFLDLVAFSHPFSGVRPWMISALLFSILAEIWLASRSQAVNRIGPEDIVLALLLAFAVAYDVAIRPQQAPDTAVNSLFFFLLVGMWMSLLLCLADKRTDVVHSLAMLRTPLVGYACYCVLRRALQSPQARGKIISSLVFFGLALSCLTIYLAWEATRNPVYVDNANKTGLKVLISTAGGYGSNYYAAILLPLVPLTFWRFGQSKWSLPLCFLPVAGIFAVISKGALLAMMGAFVLTIPRIWEKGRRLKFVSLVLIGCALAGLAFAVFPQAFEVNAFYVSMFFQQTDQARVYLWENALRNFVENPFAGVGPGNTHAYNLHDGRIDEIFAHNYVLNALSDTGLVGAIPFVALIAVILKRSLTLPRSSSGTALRMSLIATLLHGLVEPTFEGEEYMIIFWMLAAIISSIYFEDRAIRMVSDAECRDDANS